MTTQSHPELVDGHFEERERLLVENRTYGLQGEEDFEATTDEEVVQRIMAEIVAQDQIIETTENFMTNGTKYESSEVVQFFKLMPKGAHLHLHNVASGCFHKFATHIKKTENLYVAMDNTSEEFPYGSFMFFAKDEIPENGGFKSVAELEEDFIYSLITVPINFETKSAKKEHIKDKWVIFGRCWQRVLPMAIATNFYDGPNSFFYEILQDQYDSGVMYLEIRCAGASDVHSNGPGLKKLSLKEFLQVAKATVELFKSTHEGFLGAKFIPCAHKACSSEVIHEQVLGIIDLKKDAEVGDFVAGFDLVGEEDKLRPLEEYISELKFCSRNGVDLILHAGETNDSSKMGLYDAMLLGTKRLGHAYDLINQPVLMSKVIQEKVAVECCPISNQCLGYVGDMRNHSGKTMIAHGIPVTISSDDPGMFHYSDVSYDWALVGKAWGLNLMQMKRMAKRSFRASQLSAEEVKVAEESFEKDWKNFIKKCISKYKK